MKIKILLTLWLLAFSNISLAEGNCPSGQYPIGDGRAVTACAPIPGYENAQPQQPQPPQGRWETRWGAIAYGSTSISTVVGMRSKRVAEKAAMSQCKASGNGTSCEIWLSFYNQCAVTVIGPNSMNAAGGPTIEAATQIALKQCEKKNTSCKVYRADCSNAEWVWY